MNIKRAKEEIRDTLLAYLQKDVHGSYLIPPVRQRPVLLMGPPGVGKTQIMEQVARECSVGLVAYTITHHTRQSAVGLPYIVKKTYGGKEYSVTEYTMSEIVASIYDKIEETGLAEGILFIDEINCVSETLAPTMLQFLQGKSFGNHKIPEGWVITAAGNPPEYNKSVRDFDVVTLDRVKVIPVEADYEVWKEYAYGARIHQAILSYLDIRRENFCRIETTVDGRIFATPRGWEDLSRLIEAYENLGKQADREVIGQYIQYPKIAKDFANYLELYYKYENDYQVDEILEGVIRENLCTRVSRASFDEKISVIGLLLSRLNRDFSRAQDQEEKTELLQGVFRQVKEETGGPGAAGVHSALVRQLEEFRGERESRWTAGLLEKREDTVWRDAASVLAQCSEELEEYDGESREDSWARLEAAFGREVESYEGWLELAGLHLERAFDFMEASFGDSQEMVIFITELNAGASSVKFLQQYECERYVQYNNRLLFTSREDVITKKIQNLGI